MPALKRIIVNPCFFLGSQLSLPKQSSEHNHTVVANYGVLSIYDRNKSITKPSGTVSKKNIKIQNGQEKKLVGRDFISLKHFSNADIKQILWTAKDLKTRMKDNGEIYQPLRGKTIALIFQKRNTNIRFSTEMGMIKLGGQTCYLGPDDIHLGVNESVKDSARVLAGMADIILARVHNQEILDELANESKVPVISGLSDLLHPLQIIADFMTMQEYFGYLRGLKIAWIGTACNVLHSLMYGCGKIGIDLNVATPVGYEPDPGITADTMKMANQIGASFQFGHDPVQAAYRADVVVTDTWTSLKQGEENMGKLQDFSGYKINRKMLKEAGGDWIFLHSLPCKKMEVTDDIFYGSESQVWQSAENRMWAVMAVMLHVLQPYKPTIPMPKYVRG